jgi:hypothetical protein
LIVETPHNCHIADVQGIMVERQLPRGTALSRAYATAVGCTLAFFITQYMVILCYFYGEMMT